MPQRVTSAAGFFAALMILTLCLFPSPALADEPKKAALVPITVRAPQDLSYLAQGIQDMLVSRLASEELVIIDPAEVDLALTGVKRPLTPKTAGAVAEKIGADFVIYGTMVAMGKNYSLNWSVFKRNDPGKAVGLARTTDENGLIDTVDEMALMVREVISGRPPTSYVSQAPEGAKPAAGATDEQDQVEEKRDDEDLAVFSGSGRAADNPLATFESTSSGDGVFKIQPVSPAPMTMSVGDLNGDGSDDILILSLKMLTIFVYEDGVAKQILRIPKPMKGRMLMVSAGDVDNDGRAEIAMTNLYGQFPSAAIFRLKGSKLVKVLSKERYHLRIIKSPRGSVLVGQEALMERFYYGNFIRYAMIGNKLRKAGTVAGHRDIEFPTLVLADLDRDGSSESIGLSYEDKLTVVSPAGKVIYRSDKPFAGTNNTVQPDRQGGDEAEREYAINSGLDVADLDGDRIPEIVVSHNNESTGRIVAKMRYYHKGSVFALNWRNGTMVPAWRTPPVRQYVAAAKIIRIKDGKQVLVMAGTDPVAFSGLMNVFTGTRGYMFTAPVKVRKDKKKKKKQ